MGPKPGPPWSFVRDLPGAARSWPALRLWRLLQSAVRRHPIGGPNGRTPEIRRLEVRVSATTRGPESALETGVPGTLTSAERRAPSHSARYHSPAPEQSVLFY